MLKLNILNMREFLRTVNACKGRVWLLRPDGGRVDLRGQYTAQLELRERFRENRNFLPVVLTVPDPGDYMRVVSYYIGDC